MVKVGQNSHEIGGNATCSRPRHDVCVRAAVHFMVETLFLPPGRCQGSLDPHRNCTTTPSDVNSHSLRLSCDSPSMWDRAHRLPTSDQSRASHSGGQLWLLQGSVREGRRGLHAESSRTFSSITEILLLHKTCRVRRPPLQLRLHSDHSPVHQLQAHKLSISANRHQDQPAAQLSLRDTVASKTRR